MRLSVYKLAVASDRSIVLRARLSWIEQHFDGKSLKDYWQPPLLMLLNKAKPLKDFIAFDLKAPVVSDRARVALAPLIGPYCECLPLINIEGIDYYAVNTLTVCDCVDLARSDILYSPDDPQRILTVNRYAFVETAVPDLPIFKVFPYGPVFVRQPFVDCVIEHGLTNAEFYDPSVDALQLLSQGKSPNVVPDAPV